MFQNPRHDRRNFAFVFQVAFYMQRLFMMLSILLGHNKAVSFRVFLWTITVLGFPCHGQLIQHHQIAKFGGGNGLSQSSVKIAAQDKSGYVWLSTQSGLVRYDGRHFKSFNSSDIPGLRNDRIGGLGVSSDGKIWAQTANNQFVTIHQPDKRSTPVPRVTDREVIIPVAGFVRDNSPAIARMYEDVEKSKTKGIVLTACTPKGDVYLTYKSKLFFIRDRQRLQIDSMYGKRELFSFTVTNDELFVQLFAGNRVRAWRNGRLVPGITRLEGDVVADHSLGEEDQFQLSWNPACSFLYAGRNIYRLVSKNGRIETRKVVSNIELEKGISVILHLEKENKLIVCLNGENGGVSIVQPALFRYPTLPKEIRSPSFFSQLRTGPDELYARNFLFSQDGKHLEMPAGTDVNNDYRSGYISESGEFYFERDLHLMKYNPRSLQRDSLAVIDGLMKAIRKDRYSKDLLVCTHFSVSRLKDDRLTENWKIPGKPMATTFLQLERDVFLLGTENGLKWFNVRKNKIERSMLDSASIWSLHRDGNGSIWIGTYGKGFYLLDGQRLVAFPLGPGKALKTVHAFIADGRGNFWLPTNDGLFFVAKKELLNYAKGGVEDVYYFRYDRGDGLTNNEFNGGSTPSHVWLADSMLSLPAIDGLVWFYPHRLKGAYPAHPILLEQLLLNGNPVSADSIRRLPAGSHAIEFEVSTPYLGNPENLRLEYKVEGYSARWERLPLEGKISLHSLPAASYRLMLRKRRSPNPGEYDQLEIPFSIAPFFYNTWWFYLLMAILVVSLAYLFIRWRTRNLEQRARELEKKVEERTRVLNKTIIRLEQSQNQLEESNQIKDRIVSMVLHDLRSPIRFLEMMGTRLVRNHRDLTEDTLQERIVEIRNSASSIYSYTNQFLTWTSTQHGLYSVRHRWIELAPLFAGIGELYSEIARYQNNELILNPGDVQCHTDPDLLMAILRNLVDNAMKYTHGGRILLTAERSEDEVKISVADTGTGMTDAQIGVFYGKEDEEEYGGLGSTLIRDLLQKLDGRLSILSQPGEGTTFTVYLSGSRLPDHKTGPGS